jgi:hypothetical protein
MAHGADSEALAQIESEFKSNTDGGSGNSLPPER